MLIIIPIIASMFILSDSFIGLVFMIQIKKNGIKASFIPLRKLSVNCLCIYQALPIVQNVKDRQNN